MTVPEKVDFKKIIAEIEAGGTSVYKIALMMHRQYTQVKRWKEGKKEPRHYEGEMLLAIHQACHIMPRAPESPLPAETPTPAI